MPASWHSVVWGLSLDASLLAFSCECACVCVCVCVMFLDASLLAFSCECVCVCCFWMPACWHSVMSQVTCLDSWCLQPDWLTLQIWKLIFFPCWIFWWNAGLAQKQHQLTVEEHMALMDNVCLWLFVAPKLKAEVSADVFEHYEAMFADGCPGLKWYFRGSVSHIRIPNGSHQVGDSKGSKLNILSL